MRFSNIFEYLFFFMSIDINESTFIYAYEEIFYKRYQGYMCIKEFFGQ